MKKNRRQFIQNAALLAGSSLVGIKSANFFKRKPFDQLQYKGRMIDGGSKFAHLLRDPDFLRSALQKCETIVPQKRKTVIVGGGVSGLSAAWWLAKNSKTNLKNELVVLETGEDVGGNSSFSKNDVSPYPWGAHYLPLPSLDSVDLLEFLKSIQVIQGYNEKGWPLYDDFFICSDPHDRLLIHGHWQEGLLPTMGINSQDKADYKTFHQLMISFKSARGSDGKLAFAIPLDESSQDFEFLKFDSMDMKSFLNKFNFKSPFLHWYVNYCCRDDYGMPYNQVSAWAGIHYFASRRGLAANADSSSVLTWPEGNGWLTKQLKSKTVDTLGPESFSTNALVFHVRNSPKTPKSVDICYIDGSTNKIEIIQAKDVIICTPRFVTEKIWPDAHKLASSLNYAPWMVSNITLGLPDQKRGFPLCWDNVSFESDSLGYVVATHQTLRLRQEKTVFTLYWPLAGSLAEAKNARLFASKLEHSEHALKVVTDLELMHPGIHSRIDTIDVRLWGHGMIVPNVNFLERSLRKSVIKSTESIHLAHSDQSGISIFEEAFSRGIKAAKKVLANS